MRWLIGIAALLGVAPGCGSGGYSPEVHDWQNADDPSPSSGNSACHDGQKLGCYEARDSSRDIGVCRAGMRTCENGRYGPCLGEVTPSPETCDALDNDCDGNVDEGCYCTEGETRPCYSGKPATRGIGECKDGTQRCVGGVWRVCEDEILPADEACNGADDDCDGSIDDGNPNGGGDCDTGLLGGCASGVELCEDGRVACLPVLATAEEICDGVDNDCDGSIDEGDVGAGEDCDTGLLGACSFGTVRCLMGSLRCVQQEQPSLEVCDGADNDCDGSVDERSSGAVDDCDTGLFGVCALGTQVCSEGELACLPIAEPVDEACNELDDDCDGSVDEGCWCHSVCVAGNALAPDCGSCADEVCQEDPFCCEFEWDNLCIGRVEDACGNAGCTPLGNCIHALCVEGGALTAGCDADTCVEQVCAASEGCCSTRWDTTCIGYVQSLCGGDCTFK